MARLPRFVIPGQPQDVIVRGNNRDALFYAENDYQFYLDKLKQACEKHQCNLHAYVLMTNHLHLLITSHKREALGKTLQTIGRYYVQYFNFTYGRTGTLFEGRYKATVIDSEHYLLSCYRYIELNPVRANMEQHPGLVVQTENKKTIESWSLTPLKLVEPDPFEVIDSVSGRLESADFEQGLTQVHLAGFQQLANKMLGQRNELFQHGLGFAV